MKILIIQENGRHDKNRIFRECFCLQRGFEKLGVTSIVWGLGHDNYNQVPDFESFDLIINLENYGDGWEPNLSNIKTKKFLWSIDAHCRGEQPFIQEFIRGNYNILLHSTKDFVDQNFKIWFPNAFDDTLIYPKQLEKKCDVGFCGSLLNRGQMISLLQNKYNFIHDNFVIGNDMVNAVNSYKIHWNKNLSNDINYRNFETIGCGVPLVTNYHYQYEELGFKHMENAIFYNDIDDMFSKIDLVLSDENLMKSIGENGYLLSKKHTYVKRSEQILELYSKL
jgi:glycosyltransferase involved in cell wall biosynthesis